MTYRSEREEKLLEDIKTLITLIKDTDGIKKIQDAITAVISGTPDVNVTDRAARLLGIIYGSQGQQLLQRAATYDLIVQLRSAGVEIDPREYTPPSTLRGNSKTVAAAATPESLVAASTTIKNSVLIQAKPANTDTVYIGDSASQPNELEPADAIVVVIDDLVKIYVKVDVNGEGVNYIGS